VRPIYRLTQKQLMRRPNSKAEMYDKIRRRRGLLSTITRRILEDSATDL